MPFGLNGQELERLKNLQREFNYRRGAILDKMERTGANQNIDPEYVQMVGGLSGELVYKPPNPIDEPIAKNATLGVKFSQDIFVFKSALDKLNIDYKLEDLEMISMGLALRIKKNPEKLQTDGDTYPYQA